MVSAIRHDHVCAIPIEFVTFPARKLKFLIILKMINARYSRGAIAEIIRKIFLLIDGEHTTKTCASSFQRPNISIFFLRSWKFLL